jgi:hypothetical protein
LTPSRSASSFTFCGVSSTTRILACSLTLSLPGHVRAGRWPAWYRIRMD